MMMNKHKYQSQQLSTDGDQRFHLFHASLHIALIFFMIYATFTNYINGRKKQRFSEQGAPSFGYAFLTFMFARTYLVQIQTSKFFNLLIAFEVFKISHFPDDSCCGDFTNTFVDLCALEAILKQGVRCLDFEIYAVDNKPVVAVSASDSVYFKQSFNYLSTSDVFNYLITYAFSGAMCPNPQDPLILHFRFKTDLVPIMNKMAKDEYH